MVIALSVTANMVILSTILSRTDLCEKLRNIRYRIVPQASTMITESESGRAFEVTPEKLIVWEFISPHRTGEEDELVATLFDVHRIEYDYISGWMPPQE